MAAYLFVCGLCYCRKYHTGGFIPMKAVATLGVSTNPRRMVDSLIKAGLWESFEQGYRVHGYQDMYTDHDEKIAKDERRQKKRDAGRKGGQASWAARQQTGNLGVCASKQDEAKNEAQTKQRASNSAEAHRSGLVPVSGVLVLGEKSEEGPAPLDEWLMKLQEDYPQHRVTYGFMTSSLFFETFQKDPRPAREVWAEMRANLENQKAGHEWRVKGMAPKLEKWLRDGLWKQRHEEHPTSTLVSDKTARTLSSAAEFVKGAGRGRN